MIPKPTEDTVTNLLAKELERLGVKAETFPIISTPDGKRKPDIWCANGGAYPVEAKFREGDLINAISKVQNDYLKFHEFIGIKGGFAILYPEELAQVMPSVVMEKLVQEKKFKVVAMFPPKDARNFAVYEGTLSEIAKILAEHVLTPPKYIEPSTDYIIKALRDSAIHITLTLKYLSGKDLETLFGGKEVFENILQYEEEKYPIEALRLASAYLLINQILFYHVLSRRTPEKFEEIDVDSLKKPEDLNRYFKSVLDVNYRTVFSYDVASRIPPAFADQVKAVISVIMALGPEKVGGDLLGTIFHDLVPFEVRKNVAAFYTNVLAAELLAWLSIDRHDVKVADLAVGSGGLLVAAYRRKRHLLETTGKEFTQDDHKRFTEEELLGIDVMPFAANVAACHLALQSPEYFTNKVNVAIWDSTELEPNRVIPSIAGLKFVFKGQTAIESFLKPKEKKKKGVVSLTGEIPEEIKMETYDVVIMNPPFTRQERIPGEYKTILNERFKDYDENLHGQLGYFGYFILLADRFLEDKGRMALVLPATSLHVRSAEGMRKLWSERYHVKYIVTTWHRLAFSESVVFREILLVAEKDKKARDAETKICVLKRLPDSMSKARDLSDKIRKAKQDWEDDDVAIKIYPYSKLSKDVTDWYGYIALSDLKLTDVLEELLSSKKLVSLSSLAKAYECDLRHYQFGTFHGFIVSSKERAQRKIDMWIADDIRGKTLVANHKELKQRVEIPVDTLGRALRRFSYVDKIDITQRSDYLILKWFDQIRDMARYLVPTNKLEKLNPKAIKSWEMRFKKRKAHLLLGRRLYLSSPGTCLIAFYSDEPTIGIDLWSLRNLEKDAAKILALWLNSSINILQLLYLGVACEGPWMKIHEYMLSRLLVPDLRKLSKRETEELLKIFDEVRNADFPSITEQFKKEDQNRKTIDKAWLKILGYKEDSEEFLKRLYASISKEIELIDKLMRPEK